MSVSVVLGLCGLLVVALLLARLAWAVSRPVSAEPTELPHWPLHKPWPVFYAPGRARFPQLLVLAVLAMLVLVILQARLYPHAAAALYGGLLLFAVPVSGLALRSWQRYRRHAEGTRPYLVLQEKMLSLPGRLDIPWQDVRGVELVQGAARVPKYYLSLDVDAAQFPLLMATAARHGLHCFPPDPANELPHACLRLEIDALTLTPWGCWFLAQRYWTAATKKERDHKAE